MAELATTTLALIRGGNTPAWHLSGVRPTMVVAHPATAPERVTLAPAPMLAANTAAHAITAAHPDMGPILITVARGIIMEATIHITEARQYGRTSPLQSRRTLPLHGGRQGMGMAIPTLTTGVTPTTTRTTVQVMGTAMPVRRSRQSSGDWVNSATIMG